jgi:hypothetical protein
MRNKNVWILVGAAAVLLVLAFLLSRGSANAEHAADAGPEKSAKKLAPVVYPRDVVARSGPRAPPTKEAAQKLDAMQRALLPQNGKGAIFVEANAIRHSPLVEKILKCRERESNDGLRQMKEKLGIDPMEDVDRIGFDGDVFVASGFFSKLKLPPELGDGVKYGDGTLWKATDEKGNSVTFGKLGDGMIVTGDEANVKAAMDRATNPSTTAGALPPGFGEGEVYGNVGQEFLQSLVADEEDANVKAIVSKLTSSTVRMNVDEDAALSLDLKAVDDGAAADLTNTLKGVFAGMHAKAISENDTSLAQLLEQARVAPGEGGSFSVDVAVPGETLLKGMGCAPDGTPLAAAHPSSPSPAAPK